MVLQHNATIEQEAKDQGVDPNLVKAIMHVENAYGRSYGWPSEAAGLSDTILPMNVGATTWRGLGFERQELDDPTQNIKNGVRIIRGIADRLEDPSVENIATLYNNTSAERVTDYGARVRDAYKTREWTKK